MKPGAVIVDVAVDQGGCIETTHETTHADPVYEVHGVLHYAVGNMPGAVPFTSTYALTNATLPLRAHPRDARRRRRRSPRTPRCAHGVNTVGGAVTHPIVAEALGPAARPARRRPSASGRVAPEIRSEGRWARPGGVAGPTAARADRARAIVSARGHGRRDGFVNGARTRCRIRPDRGVQRARQAARRGRRLGLVQRVEDLFTVDLDLAGSLDADAHLLAADLEHGHHDVVPDHDALVGSPCEHEQPGTPSVETTLPPAGQHIAVDAAVTADVNASVIDRLERRDLQQTARDRASRAPRCGSSRRAWRRCARGASSPSAATRTATTRSRGWSDRSTSSTSTSRSRVGQRARASVGLLGVGVDDAAPPGSMTRSPACALAHRAHELGRRDRARHQRVDVQAQQLRDRVGRRRGRAARRARGGSGCAREPADQLDRPACPATRPDHDDLRPVPARRARRPRRPVPASPRPSTPSAAQRRRDPGPQQRRAVRDDADRGVGGHRADRSGATCPASVDCCRERCGCAGGGPPGTRTLNQRVKSPVLCLLS